jgi:predicted RecA/RadA family phage recombinase
MARKVSYGQSVRVTATGAVEKDKFALVGGFFGLALNSVGAEGGDVVLDIQQAEYETAQIATGATFTVGSPVYFASAGEFTNTATGNRLVGTVTEVGTGVIRFILAPQIASAIVAGV